MTPEQWTLVRWSTCSQKLMSTQSISNIWFQKSDQEKLGEIKMRMNVSHCNRKQSQWSYYHLTIYPSEPEDARRDWDKWNHYLVSLTNLKMGTLNYLPWSDSISQPVVVLLSFGLYGSPFLGKQWNIFTGAGGEGVGGQWCSFNIVLLYLPIKKNPNLDGHFLYAL